MATQYLVRTGTLEHLAHTNDFHMPVEYGNTLEDAKTFFRAVRDMVDPSEPYTIKVALIEVLRGVEREVEAWQSRAS